MLSVLEILFNRAYYQSYFKLVTYSKFIAVRNERTFAFTGCLKKILFAKPIQVIAEKCTDFHCENSIGRMVQALSMLMRRPFQELCKGLKRKKLTFSVHEEETTISNDINLKV